MEIWNCNNITKNVINQLFYIYNVFRVSSLLQIETTTIQNVGEIPLK